MSDPILDPLDAAIDRVAHRLVSVKGDPDAVRRILTSLPVRRERAWWSWSSWPLQAVALASVLLAAVYIRVTNDDLGLMRTGGRPVAMLSARPMDALAELRLAAPRVAVGETIAPRRRSVRPPGVADSAVATAQSFGLSPIAGPDSLSLPTLDVTAPLATIEPATVAPIALTELPLSIETPPPFFKE